MPVWAVVIVALVWGAVLAAVVAAFRAPARIDLQLDGGVLIVELGPWDRLLCLRGPVRVPLRDIRAVRAVDRDELPRPGLRLPGSSLPGVVTAGSYGVGAQRSFWDVRRARRVLLVVCRPGAEYARLVLELPDPDAAAQRLTHSLAAGA
jgi:hypothetical protein